ncbi:enoyl-CoA hydratase-related protein [Mycolicibacterium sp. XJ1819]
MRECRTHRDAASGDNALDAAVSDADIRAIVIAGRRAPGAGRASCAGADLGAQDDGNALLAAANQLALTIRTVDKPITAVVKGQAEGMDASLALECDVTMAAKSAYFLLAFTGIGLMPDGGATHVRSHAHGSLGRTSSAQQQPHPPGAITVSTRPSTVHPRVRPSTPKRSCCHPNADPFQSLSLSG